MITHLDWFVTKRMISRILGVVFLFFCLILLSESLDTWRFETISKISGDAIAWLAVFTSAIRWSIKTLSITVLLGAIIGLVEFQAHREFIVMKASGISIWRIARGPILFVILLGSFVTLVAESASTRVNREINPTPPGLGGGIARSTTDIWLQQSGENGTYFLQARSARENGSILYNVAVFPNENSNIRRINAERAEFSPGFWNFINANITLIGGATQFEENYMLSTKSTGADLRVSLGSTEDFTFFELIDVLTSGVSDPAIKAAAQTRLAKLTSLPLLLVGSLLIAFAFTAGYRRGNPFGMSLVYGIIMGFIVFVITEMADRAGSSGVLQPAIATWGPAVIAVLVGLSVLLNKEDGTA
ncbi:MAG: LptF/LptG family permease [Devosiaceae bacterium]|nr:LptF/LptG family permease [Devosiaceae bacterium]